MIYIGLSIASSSIILLLFRWFSSFGVNTRHAIVVNYGIAAIIGYSFFEISSNPIEANWFVPAALLGIIFYSGFRLIAKTTQTSGVAAASIATKMSMIIPVLVGILILEESIGWQKITGVTLGFLAVLSSSDSIKRWSSLVWPLVTFLVSGFIDTSLNLFQLHLVSADQYPVFISTIFGWAFVTGVTHHFWLANKRIQPKSLFGGFFLGIVNFGSLWFVLSALSLPNWESSVVFPINNVGVVAASTVLALIIFKEKLTKRGMLGVLLSFTSILLLYFSL